MSKVCWMNFLNNNSGQKMGTSTSSFAKKCPAKERPSKVYIHFNIQNFLISPNSLSYMSRRWSRYLASQRYSFMEQGCPSQVILCRGSLLFFIIFIFVILSSSWPVQAGCSLWYMKRWGTPTTKMRVNLGFYSEALSIHISKPKG